jgi:Domain of unknown function (DUF6794)
MLGLGTNRPVISRPARLAFGGLLLLIVAVAVFMRLTAVETKAGPWLLGPENWPVTVDETVKDILPQLPLYRKLEIRFMKKEHINSMHLDLGLSIRNRYGLWRGNDKLILSACGYQCHPDDASMKIIEAVWQALHK